MFYWGIIGFVYGNFKAIKETIARIEREHYYLTNDEGAAGV